VTDAPDATLTPLRFDAGALVEFRRGLEAAGFTADAITARAGVPTIYDFVTLRDGRPDPGLPNDALDTLVRLLIDGEPVPCALADAHLPAALIAAAQRLGLVRTVEADERVYVPTVLLYPTHGVYITSDLEHDPLAPRGAPYDLPDDVVYAAITGSTRTFLSLLPDTPCDRFLELCAGTGIAALIAAPRAGTAVATDIAERSVAFARFNAALNGFTNVRVASGDLYGPVAGETFDRIVAHPPYMPALQDGLIYRDGGEDGEQITRRILEGLPEHLVPGGRFDCTCILTDRKGAPVEARIRTMLGEHAAEFDIIVVVTQANDPEEAYARLVREQRASFDNAVQHVRRFRALGTERIVGCSLVLLRHDRPRPAVTVRRARSEHTDAAAIEWLSAWMRVSGDPTLTERLLDARPRLSPNAQLKIDYVAAPNGWQAEGCGLLVDSPFAMAVNVSMEVASFLASCDGTKTVREHVALMVRDGTADADTDPLDFAGMVRSFAVGGFLLTDVPAPAG
jgi:methylase of polypeptide subunit release factors